MSQQSKETRERRLDQKIIELFGPEYLELDKMYMELMNNKSKELGKQETITLIKAPPLETNINIQFAKEMARYQREKAALPNPNNQ